MAAKVPDGGTAFTLAVGLALAADALPGELVLARLEEPVEWGNSRWTPKRQSRMIREGGVQWQP